MERALFEFQILYRGLCYLLRHLPYRWKSNEHDRTVKLREQFELLLKFPSTQPLH